MLRLYNCFRNRSRESRGGPLASFLSLTLLLLISAGNSFAQGSTVIENFTSPLNMSNWTIDRWQPSGFQSENYLGDGRLRLTIDSTQSWKYRSGGLNGHHNTQGYARILPTLPGGVAITEIAVDLYVPASYQLENKRVAGFWGTAVDGASAAAGFPIIEFTSDSLPGNGPTPVPRWQVWENTGWVSVGLDPGFSYDAWSTLRIKLLPSGEFEYYINSHLVHTTSTFASAGAAGFSQAIFQGYNYNPALPIDSDNNGANYEIYFDNLAITPGVVNVEGTVTGSTSAALCDGTTAGINITVSVNPAVAGTFSGSFTNGKTFTNLAPAAGIISPQFLFENNTLSPQTEQWELATLEFKANATGLITSASQLGGQSSITVYPVADIHTVNNTGTEFCGGGAVSIAVSNPNSVGGHYNRQTILNGAVQTAATNISGQAYGTFQDSLSNPTNAPVEVVYIFTPIAPANGCVGERDTIRITVNPMPTLASFDITPACEGDSSVLTFTGLLPNRSFIAEATFITDSGSFDMPGMPVVSDPTGTYVYGGIAAPEFNGVIISITALVDTLTGCRTEFIDMADTMVIYPNPIAVFTIDGDTAVVDGTSTICQAAEVALAINGEAGHVFSLEKVGVGVISTDTLDANGEFSYTLPASGLSTAGDYILTLTNPVTGCIGVQEYNLQVNPKPDFVFEVNGNSMVDGETDTICQAASTTFALTGSTQDFTFDVVHVYNNGADTNAAFASGVLDANGEFEHTFISGGNSGTAPEPGDEPTEGTYIITVTNNVTGCTATRSYNVYVNPKPEFALVVNGAAPMVDGQTDTICQAAATEFVLQGGALDSFFVTHIYQDGNGGFDTNYAFASGELDASGNFTHNFTSGGNSVNPVVSPGNEPTEGTYVVTMRNNATGCEATRSYNIYVNPKPEISLAVNGGTAMVDGQTDTICQAASTEFKLIGTPNATFTVSHTYTGGSNPNYASGSLSATGEFTHTFISGGNSVNPNPTPGNEPTEGTYEVTVTDPITGCEAIYSFNIYVNPKPEFVFSANGTALGNDDEFQACLDESVTLTLTSASTDLSYELYQDTVLVGAGNVNDPAYTFTASNSDAGMYYLTVTNTTTGCINTDSFELIVNPLPEATLSANGTDLAIGDTLEVCDGADFTLALTGATAHAYELTHNGNPVTTGNVNDPEVTFAGDPALAGTYEFTYTNTTTGCVSVATYEVVINPLPVATLTANGDTVANGAIWSICAADSVTLSLTGAENHAYTLSLEGTQIAAGNVNDPAVTFAADDAMAGVYVLNYTNTVTGCVNADTIEIVVTPLPEFTLTANSTALSGLASDTSFYCENDVVELEITGDNSHTYVLELGGTPIASGNVGDPAVSLTAIQSASGSYVVTVTNPATGCETQAVYNIHVNETPNITIDTMIPAACYGESTGSFRYTISGTAQAPYTVNILDVANDTVFFTLIVPSNTFSANQNNLAAGDYKVYVTNQHGCSDTVDVTVGQPASALSLNMMQSGVTCGGSNDGQITFDLAGGTAPYNVVVTGPSTNTSFTFPVPVAGWEVDNLGAGTYTINITDDHGCTLTETQVVVAPTLTAVTATVSGPDTAYTGTPAQVTLDATGLVAPVTFVYSVNGDVDSIESAGTSATLDIPVSAAGTFTYEIVSVTDANGEPCNLNIGATHSVEVVDGSGADLVPFVVFANPSFNPANPEQAFTLKLYNYGALPTVGNITFNVFKPTSAMVMTTSGDWSVTDHGFWWTITNTAPITVNGGYASTTINGTLNIGASGKGRYTLLFNLTAGSGGDIDDSNNSAAQLLNIND